MSDNADTGTGAKGNFLAVDSRLWESVRALGLNEAVSYLVQARGTARDNRTTTWSVESSSVIQAFRAIEPQPH
jgi:hypothetical protein